MNGKMNVVVLMICKSKYADIDSNMNMVLKQETKTLISTKLLKALSKEKFLLNTVYDRACDYPESRLSISSPILI